MSAVKQYKHGDTILTSKPFAFVIFSTHRSGVCDECWRRVDPGSGSCCTSCGVVRYCDWDCRDRAALSHSQECGTVRREKHCSDLVRLIATVCRKVRDDKENLVEQNGSQARHWRDLMSHSSQLASERREELEQDFKQLATALPDHLMPDWETFLSVCGKILTNCFCLRSDRKVASEPFGIGLYLLASQFDHSCSPNSTVVFQGRELRVMAERDLEPGETPSISYVNILLETETRRSHLRTNWFFTCHCTSCLDIKSDSVKRSVVCVECGGPRPVSQSGWTVRDPCQSCGARAGGEQQEVVERYRDLVTIIEQINTKTGEVEEADYNYQSCWLAAVMGEVCSDRDIRYIKLCHYVHTICMNHALWEPAILYGETVLPAFRFYYGEKSKIVAALLIRLHEASYYAGKSSKADEYLEEACSIYKLIPGENHPLYYQDIAKFTQFADAD